MVKEWRKFPALEVVRNQVFTGVLLSFATYAFSSMIRFFEEQISSLFSTSVRFTNRDEAYQWFHFYLSQHPSFIKTSTTSLMTQSNLLWKTNAYSQNSSTMMEKEKHKSRISSIPHFSENRLLPYHFIFKNKMIFLRFFKNESLMSQQSTVSAVQEITVEITCLGRNNKKILLECVEEWQRYFLEQKFGKILLYVPDLYCDVWEPRVTKQKRKAQTLILKEGLFENLLQDCRDFLSRQQWYDERGIPFRKGYLLYGPPGSGKSSTTHVIAGALDLNICIVNISNSNLTDEKLNQLLLNAPPYSLILLEDIDRAFTETHASNKAEECSEHSSVELGENHQICNVGISLSGLLNCIDGVIASEQGRILIMTANDLTKLPRALIRPGRIDKLILIDYADDQQCVELFCKFYPNHSLYQIPLIAQEFVTKLKQIKEQHSNFAKKQFTPAQIQGFLMNYKDDPQEALKHVETLFTNDFVHCIK